MRRPMTMPAEWRRRWLPGLLGLLLLQSVTAQEWQALTPTQQQTLAPFESDWPELGSEQRERLLASAQRWIDLPPERREALAARMAIWQGLSAEERKLLIEHRRQREQRDGQGQRILRKRFEALPPEQRQAAIERFRALPPAQRRAFLHGMAVGAEVIAGEPLRQLMEALEPDERRLLRQRVGAMTEDQRKALRAQMRTLSPQQRVDLARRVIQVGDATALQHLLDAGAKDGDG